jgi:hypothetical protein
MSKSRGTFITAESYLAQGLNPEWLRYYYAAKLSSSMEDIDLNLDDFIARVNSDLVGKFVNIASRAAGFIVKRFAGQLCPCDESLPAIEAIRGRRSVIADHYEAREFSKAIREIMALTDTANQYVDSVKPWELARQEGRENELQAACTNALNLFRLLAILLKPVLPALAAKVEAFLNVAPFVWDDGDSVLAAGHAINPYQHLLTRVEKKQVDALVEANRDSLAAAPQPAPQKHAEQQEKAAAVAVAQAAVGPDAGPHIRHRPVPQRRSAYCAHRRGLAGRRRRQTRSPRSRYRPARYTAGFRRHQGRLRAGGAGRANDGDGRQPGATQDEVRPLRRHGPRRFRWPMARPPASSCFRPTPVRKPACASLAARSGMDRRHRPRVTAKVMLYALLDVAGTLILASGLMWLARQQALFVPDFPTDTTTAVLTVAAGFALMLWSVAGIIRELSRQRPADDVGG